MFAYNGSVSCIERDEFLVLIILALLIVIIFVGPTPFAVGYISVKRRPQVSNSVTVTLNVGIFYS